MDADKPKLSATQGSISKGKGEFEIFRVRLAAEKARRIAEYDALNRIQPPYNVIAFPTRP